MYTIHKILIAIALLTSVHSHAESVYLAKVNFAGTMFNDLLVLSPTEPLTESLEVKGSLTVPGAFTTKFIAYRGHTNIPSFDFTTTAIENGNEITIIGHLVVVGMSDKYLSGYLEVYLDGGKTKVKAELSAELIYKDKK